MPEQVRPNPSDMEPAEGSRETVNANFDENDPARDRFRDSAERKTEETGGGITNRPLDREIEEQREVPRRGGTREEDR